MKFTVTVSNKEGINSSRIFTQTADTTLIILVRKDGYNQLKECLIRQIKMFAAAAARQAFSDYEQTITKTEITVKVSTEEGISSTHTLTFSEGTTLMESVKTNGKNILNRNTIDQIMSAAATAANKIFSYFESGGSILFSWNQLIKAPRQSGEEGLYRQCHVTVRDLEMIDKIRSNADRVLSKEEIREIAEYSFGWMIKNPTEREIYIQRTMEHFDPDKPLSQDPALNDNNDKP